MGAEKKRKKEGTDGKGKRTIMFVLPVGWSTLISSFKRLKHLFAVKKLFEEDK